MALNLFDKVYNPDVLSCLANLSNDEVFTPPEIANQMLDMLPQELFERSDTTFLDPACKSGVFLREIAKRMLSAQLPGYEDMVREIEEKKRHDVPLDANDTFFEETLQKKVDHIFHKQLFGIAITELTSLLSRRSVYCSKYPNSEFSITRFEESEGNIRFRRTEHTWKDGRCIHCGASQSEYERDEALETHAYEWIHTVKPEELFDMRFDVILGNPPYQLSTGGSKAQAIPLYDKFVSQAKKLGPRYLTMIIPARWFSGGFGLDGFRKDMISDNRVRVLHDFVNSTECFGNGVEIKGGVCYFLWSKDEQGPCKVYTHKENNVTSATRYLCEADMDAFIRWNEGISVYHKVKKIDEASFMNLVSSQKPFGIGTAFRGRKSAEVGDVKVYENGGIGYIAKHEIIKNVEDIDKYKVYISAGYNGGDNYPHQILGKPIIGEPNSCCSETYVEIGPFASEEEAHNVAAYMRTKFFRFMVMLLKNTQHALKKVYQLAPQQDFSERWTDEKLYKKYGLTDDEIAFIDSMIKPMDLGGDTNG